MRHEESDGDGVAQRRRKGKTPRMKRVSGEPSQRGLPKNFVKWACREETAANGAPPTPSRS